jgi:hypothetical protein
VLVSEVIDRTYNEWLYPAGIDRPAFDTVKTLGALSGVGEGTFELDGRIANVPRDTVLEIGSELIQTSDVTGAAPTVVVTTAGRGFLGSVAAAHVVGERAYLNPKYPRVSVFNAVVALVGRLHSLGLYARATDTTATFGATDVKELPAGGIELISVTVKSSSGYEQYRTLRPGYDYFELRQFTPPKYQLIRGASNGAAMTVVYAKDFVAPTSESDDIVSDCLVSAQLAPYIPMWVAGYLLQGRDLPRVVVQEIRRMLAAQAGEMPPGAAMNMGMGLMNAFERKYVLEERARQARKDPPTFEWVGYGR